MSKKKKHQRRVDTNPARSRREKAVQERKDGWISALAGQGTMRDKRRYMTFTADGTNWQENLELWRGDDLAGRIVETIPNEMMRQGWELVVDSDDGKEIAERVKGLLEDLCCDSRLWQGLCFENAYGGGAVMIGTQDSDAFDQPLNYDSVTKLNFLTTFEPQELQVASWQTDPSRPGFGDPELYRLNPVTRGGSKKSGILIHASRLLVFPGIQVSRRQVTTQAGWGDAVLTRCRETLRDFQTSWAAAGLLVADFAQAVWKIKGLAEIIALDKDEEIAKRIAAMDLASSTVRAKVLDADGEEWKREQTPVSGLPELLDRFATRLCASADIPVTLLMGMSPAGLNATGESDVRTFYDRVKARQKRKLKGHLERLCRVAFHALGIEEPDNWHVTFNPLWQPTEKEIAETRKTIMETDVGYFGIQVLGSDEIRENRFGGREFSAETKVDPKRVIQPPQPDAEYQQMAADHEKPTLPPTDEEETPAPKPKRVVKVKEQDRSISAGA